MINVGSAGWPTRGVPRIAVLSPRNIRNVLNASTEALVDGLSHYRVETQVFDTWVSREAGVRDLLRGRFDAVFAVVGSQLVEGPDHWNLDLLDLLTAPLLYRLADPPFTRRYLTGLEAMRQRATVSIRDQDCGDFLAGAGIRPQRIHYVPGRYHDRQLDASAVEQPLHARDIPFLYAGTVENVDAIDAYARTLMPDRLPQVRALSDALLAEPVRPTWKVAEDVYENLGSGLVPYLGLGRALLDLANRHANARFRKALIDRLSRHDGVLVLDGNAQANGPVRAGKARQLGRRSHSDVLGLMQRSRVVVATPPNFCVGAVSERVYWSMALGSVSLALRTPAMDRHFDRERHYRPFDRAFEGLEETIVDATEHPDGLQGIADAGRRHVRAEFSNITNVKLLFEPVLDIGEPMAPEHPR